MRTGLAVASQPSGRGHTSFDVRAFVASNRSGWEHLEELLRAAARNGLASLSPRDLRDLGLLHRRVSGDLAAARSAGAGSKVIDYLNDLAVRSHNAVYRAPRRSLLRILADLAYRIPVAVRSQSGALAASAGIFAIGAMIGAFGTVLDERVATLVLGTAFVEKIREGEYWVVRIFNVVPTSLLSSSILTNNLSVAISLFAFGITGLLPTLILLNNGVMLGVLLVLCAQYGLLPRFLAFVFPHGVIEISAILLAAAGGFTVLDGWLAPGPRTRLEGLRLGARKGLLVAAAAVPALILAAFVEAGISPVESLAPWLRIALGIGLGLALWGWVYGSTKGPMDET